MKTIKTLFVAILMILPLAANAQNEGVNFVEGKSLYEVLQWQRKLINLLSLTAMPHGADHAG